MTTRTTYDEQTLQSAKRRRACFKQFSLLMKQGKLSEAESLYHEALRGWREALGDAHPVTLSSLNNLAVLLKDQGRLSEAEALCREALRGQREALGDAHPVTLGSLNNLAVLLKDQGRLI